MKQLMNIDGLVELAQKAKADSEEWVVKSLLSIALTGNQSLMKAVTTRLAIPAFIETIDPFPFDSAIRAVLNPDLFREYLLLGKVKGTTETPFWLLIRNLLMHCLVLGRTGSGKTNLFFLLIAQLLNRVAIWVLDRKLDYRHLLRMYPNKFYVFNFTNNFRCNPLCPPEGVHPKIWMQLIADLFCRTTSLLDASLSLLTTIIDHLYAKYGVYAGSGNYPTFLELVEFLKTMKTHPRSRTEGYRVSLLNRLGAFLATTPELYNCSKGYPLEELIKKSIVFELHGLLEPHAKFLVNYLLHWLFCYRIHHKQRGTELRNLCVFDEAH